MRIVRAAVAGSLESSDALVKVAPNDELEVDIQSTVMGQYGDAITTVVNETLEKLGVTEGFVSVDDKGALDFAIRARVQGAVFRGSDEQPDWSWL